MTDIGVPIRTITVIPTKTPIPAPGEPRQPRTPMPIPEEPVPVEVH